MKHIPNFKYWLFMIGALALTACAHSAPNTAKGASANAELPAPIAVTPQTLRAERLDRVMTNLVDENKIAGVSVLIIENGTESYYGAKGMLDREAGTPMSRDAVGRYYSMTKPIVGVAMMQLYEDGKYKLDDPLSKYLPEFTNMKVFAGVDAQGNSMLVNANRQITVRDLMRHTSGLTYGFITQTPVDAMYLEANILSYEQTSDAFSKKIASMPLLKQPGEQYIYSVSTDVQGRLIEVLSGQSLGDYLETHIFAPLGMSHTGFNVKAADRDKFGPVYSVQDGRFIRLEDEMEKLPFVINEPFLNKKPFESGGGGLVSTLDDYAKFTVMLRARGGKLISPDSHALMTSNQLSDIDNSWLGPNSSFGLNFAIKTAASMEGALPVPKGTYYWGGMAGTSFWIDPTNDIIFIMQMQMITPDEYDNRDRVVRAVYGQ